MRERLKKIERIRKVQEQLHHMAEWKLSQLQRQRVDLQNAQESLIRELNDDRLYGLFMDAAARRLKAIAAEAEKIETERAVQADITLQRALDVKRTEKTMASVREAHRRGLEKRDLQDILESVVARGDASSA